MTNAEALRAAADRLAAVSDTARLDAELLLAHALGCSRSELLLRYMQQPVPAAYIALVERRLAHEPVAYITGVQEFFGRPFAVAPGVLIPRADSETVVEAALAACPVPTSVPARVLDCGVGPGTLLLTVLAECPAAHGVGIDRSGEALAIAASNAQALGLADRANLRQRDWTVPDWLDGLGLFDLVLANPPYVEQAAELDPQVSQWEPAGALFAGADGLDDYRLLVPQLPALLAPGGMAVLEIGATQGPAVSALAQAQGLTVALHRDLGGRPRALVVRF